MIGCFVIEIGFIRGIGDELIGLLEVDETMLPVSPFSVWSSSHNIV